MHFTTTTGAILAFTATLASASPITKEARAAPIDPSKPFQITAVGPDGPSHVAVFNLYSYFSNYKTGQDVPATLRLHGSGSGEPSTFTFSGTQLSVLASIDQAGPCDTPDSCETMPYGNVPIKARHALDFQDSTGEGGLVLKDNQITGKGDKNATQFGMCPEGPEGKEFVLKYKPTSSDCIAVTLVAHLPGSD